jgi:hypothetical protein
MAAICRTCTRRRNANQLLCPRCWALVPKPLQDAVWDAYKPNARHQSLAYLRAAADAVKAAETALAGQPEGTTP